MEIIENDFIKFWKEDGILFSEYKKPTTITLENAREVVRMRHDISAGKNMYWCYDLAKLKSISSDAREYVTKEGQQYLSASAMIFNSHITKFIFNAYFTINKPEVPTKAFRTVAEGYKWLKEIRDTKK